MQFVREFKDKFTVERIVALPGGKQAHVYVRGFDRPLLRDLPMTLDPGEPVEMQSREYTSKV